jgi:hypothetical protein
VTELEQAIHDRDVWARTVDVLARQVRALTHQLQAVDERLAVWNGRADGWVDAAADLSAVLQQTRRSNGNPRRIIRVDLLKLSANEINSLLTACASALERKRVGARVGRDGATPLAESIIVQVPVEI